MEFDEKFKNHYLKGHEKYLRHISVDNVIFGFHQNDLKVLLLKSKYAGLWSLSGGFVLKDETIDRAAQRVLKQRTGLEKIFLRVRVPGRWPHERAAADGPAPRCVDLHRQDRLGRGHPGGAGNAVLRRPDHGRAAETALTVAGAGAVAEASAVTVTRSHRCRYYERCWLAC